LQFSVKPEFPNDNYAVLRPLKRNDFSFEKIIHEFRFHE